MLAERLVDSGGAALVVGGSRSARTAVISEVADDFAKRRGESGVVSADLGLPLLGPPGAVTLASRRGGRFEVLRIEALSTLDSARFRLPLVLAAFRLRAFFPTSSGLPLLVDAPWVNRGMAGAELLTALVEALGVRTIVVLGDADKEKFENEILATGARLVELEDVTGGAPIDRAVDRTRLWDAFLQEAEETTLSMENLPLVGSPPPRDSGAAFVGRQIALLGAQGETLAFGEVTDCDGARLRARLRALAAGPPASLLVRDARRDDERLLSTDRAHRAPAPSVFRGEKGSSDLWSREHHSELNPRPPVMTLTSAKALLVNGIFGDPLLHVRLRHRRRSLLFDLGETSRLAGRILHQVTDVFVTHAHFDHIAGFLWLLRASIASPIPRSLYGPPGLSRHLAGMIAGILWDRIGDRGPVFEVSEVHPGRAERFRLQAGRKTVERLEDRILEGDVLLEEPEFRVRVTTLDHGVPVLAFAFEETHALHVRVDRLAETGLAPGPWLSELKRLVLENRREAEVALPDGTVRAAGELERDLLRSRPGEKLVYATDFAASNDNHEALAALAADARVLFCEASFIEEDEALARASGHLTARSCGRIAASARVSKLVPFHFSKRYEADPSRVYREVLQAFPRTVVAT